MLDEYQVTTSQARELIERAQTDLAWRLTVLRGLVIALGLVYCLGQVLPIHLGNRMARVFARPAPDEE